MKYSLFFACFFSICLSLYSQNSSLKVRVLPDLTSDNLRLKITSTSDTLANLQFKIFDFSNKMVKNIGFPNAFFHLDTTISIKNLAVGKYFFAITKGEKQLLEGQFNKDIYDELE